MRITITKNIKLSLLIAAIIFGFSGIVCLNMSVHAHGQVLSNSAAAFSISDSHEKCCNAVFTVAAALPGYMPWRLPFDAHSGFFSAPVFFAVLAAGRFVLWDIGSRLYLFLYLLYLRYNPDFLSFNSLKYAFARGLLHPKIY